MGWCSRQGLTRRTLLAAAVTPVVARALPPRGAQAAQTSADVLETSQVHLGTNVSLRVLPAAGQPREVVHNAMAAAWAEFERVGRLTSATGSDSDVARINAAAGSASVVVSAEVFALVQRCLEFSAYSGGVFDVTYAALSGLWRFEGDQPTAPPDPREVKRLRALIDYRRVVMDPARSAIMLPSAGMRLGLGGVARGYAVDCAARVLTGTGVQAFVIRAGGVTLGEGRFPWAPLRMAVPDPRVPARPLASVEIKDGALAWVGDHERFFVVGGKRYHHIIDPRTGYPAGASRLAAVLAKSAVDADWLTKAVFILGLKDGEQVLQRVGAQALVMTTEGKVEMTEGMRRRTELL
ncbi:MAG: FAD:protein FMN transferase [Myxococcota bacterium]